MDYCISPDAPNATQQCGNCQLIDGQLYNNGGHAFPNCPGTQWVQVASIPGTNNTPVYQVVPLPFDSILMMGAIGIMGALTIIKNKFI